MTLQTPTNAQQLAAEFAISLAEIYPDYKFVNVGHSLGGNNAQAATAALADAGFSSSGVTFNAPGASNFRHAEDPASYNILNIIAHTDIISLAGGQHFGKSVIVPAGPEIGGVFAGTSALMLNNPISPFITASTAMYQLLGPAHSLLSLAEYLSSTDPTYGGRDWGHYDNFHSVSERSWQVSVDQGKVALNLDGMTLTSSVDLLNKLNAYYSIQSKDSSGADVIFENNQEKFLFARRNDTSSSEFKRSEDIVTMKHNDGDGKAEMVRNSNGDLRIAIAANGGESELISYGAGIVYSRKDEYSHRLLTTHSDGLIQYDYRTSDTSYKVTIFSDRSSLIETTFVPPDDYHRNTLTTREEISPTGSVTRTITTVGGSVTVLYDQISNYFSGNKHQINLGHSMEFVAVSFDSNGLIKTIDNGYELSIVYEDGNLVEADLMRIAATYSHNGDTTKFTSNLGGKSRFFSSGDSENEISTTDYTYKFRDGMLEHYRDESFGAHIKEYSSNEFGLNLYGDTISMHSYLDANIEEKMPDGGKQVHYYSVLGHYRKTVYDKLGNIKYVERETISGKSVTYENENRVDYYNFAGTLTLQKYSGLADGREVTLTYDDNGGKLVVTKFEGTTEEIFYKSNGTISYLTLTLADASSKKTEYDNSGAISKTIETSKDDIFTTEFFENGGRREIKESGYDKEITEFDGNNRIDSVTVYYDSEIYKAIDFSYKIDGTYSTVVTENEKLVISDFDTSGILLKQNTTTPTYKQFILYDIAGDYSGRTDHITGNYEKFISTSGVTITDFYSVDDIRSEQMIYSSNGIIRKFFDVGGFIFKQTENGPNGYFTKFFAPNGEMVKEEYQGPLGAHTKIYADEGSLELYKGRDIYGKDWEIVYDANGREISNVWNQSGTHGIRLIEPDSGQYSARIGLAGAVEGLYTFSNGTTNGITFGRAGTDEISVTSDRNLIAGSYGDDLIQLNAGRHVILYNMGDGLDTIDNFHQFGGVVSLGKDIKLGSISLNKFGDDLTVIFSEITSQQIIFRDWYSGAVADDNFYLQILTSPASTSTEVMSFKLLDFKAIVNEFDSMRNATTGPYLWLLPNDLSRFKTEQTSDEYFGGDLAFNYASVHNTTIDIIGMKKILIDLEFLM